ncbi:hypothetical protein EYF80_052626 [Liparis tanakae]|uniref:Uncharacterized protein n=1 Tax=Liparis tanakae TaxID=230148 RepID=A0A4Z2F8K3_9TELE|nr:hypothetical protein EYF80_052626 [Liparis tanakae]
MRCINQSFTTRIAHVDGIPLSVPLWQFLHTSTRGRPPPAAVSVGGGRRDGRRTAGLRVLQVAGVAEEVAVQRVAAVTLLVVELHLTALLHTEEEQDEGHSVQALVTDDTAETARVTFLSAPLVQPFGTGLIFPETSSCNIAIQHLVHAWERG